MSGDWRDQQKLEEKAKLATLQANAEHRRERHARLRARLHTLLPLPLEASIIIASAAISVALSLPIGMVSLNMLATALAGGVPIIVGIALAIGFFFSLSPEDRVDLPETWIVRAREHRERKLAAKVRATELAEQSAKLATEIRKRERERRSHTDSRSPDRANDQEAVFQVDHDAWRSHVRSRPKPDGTYFHPAWGREHTHVDDLTGDEFEYFLEYVFRWLGYNVRHVGGPGDHGVDLVVEADFGWCVVQAKRYSGVVPNTAVQEAFAGIAMYNCEYAVVVTNSYLSEGAVMLAQRNRVAWIDRDGLAMLLRGEHSMFPRRN